MIYKNFSQKDFDEAEKAYNTCAQRLSREKTVPAKKVISRGQYTSLLIAFMIFIYSILFSDIPAFFLSMAFFAWMLRHFSYKFGRKYEHAAQALLKSLSLTLFAGSIALLFL